MPRPKSKEPAPMVPRRVAVLVDTSTDWGRRIITGIVDYVREHERWHLLIEPIGVEEQVEVPKGWRGHGIIARVSTEAMARRLKARRLPVVNVSGVQINGPQFPRVANDVRLVAGMAAEYFL